VNGFGGDYRTIALLSPDGVLVSSTVLGGSEIANARLIAAAPELLEAWDAGRVTIPGPDFLEWIADRLDRTEGRAFGDVNGGMDYCIRLRRLAAAGRAAIAKAAGR
jgi:hypothetical protein